MLLPVLGLEQVPASTLYLIHSNVSTNQAELSMLLDRLAARRQLEQQQNPAHAGMSTWRQSLASLLLAVLQAQESTTRVPIFGRSDGLEREVHQCIESYLSPITNDFHNDRPLPQSTPSAQGCAIFEYNATGVFSGRRSFCDFLLPRKKRPTLVGGELRTHVDHVICELKAFHSGQGPDARAEQQLQDFTFPLRYGQAWVTVFIFARVNARTGRWDETDLRLYFASRPAAIEWLTIHRETGLGPDNQVIQNLLDWIVRF